MGKKRGSRKKGVGTTPSSGSITLREESSGKKKQSHINAKSMLKLEHLKNLASWASGEASIPSLGAFFGQRLAASAESLGVPPDPSLFACQRCESILQDGYNCTVRIEKNKRKGRNRCKKPGIPRKNCIVYKCHFCSHRNLKRGTPTGYMKELYPTKTRTSSIDSTTRSATQQLDSDSLVANLDKTRVDPTEAAVQKSERFGTSVASIDSDNRTGAIVSSGDDPADSPATPLPTVTVTSLLDVKRRKRNRTGSKKKDESEDSSSITDADKTGPVSGKRKRKSWTSLKEIAESDGSNGKKFSNISVPFIL